MGANIWQRDTTGSGQGTTFKIGPAAVPQPARPGKRKLVWTKDQQDQPSTPAAFAPSPATYRGTDAPSSSYSQQDHFEKRARLNDSMSTQHNGYHRGHEAPQRRHQARVPPLPETRKQQTGATSQDPAAVLERREKEAELAELKRRIQEHEEQAAEHKVRLLTFADCLIHH